eukprot:NODE_126_length_17250_cov_2.558743.p2 type:complete len:627 gc:universal NODE_126_length_17250_cov_2.558743:17034-15154(-)
MEFLLTLYSTYRIQILMAILAFVIIYKRKTTRKYPIVDSQSLSQSVKIFYATTTLTSKQMAADLQKQIPNSKIIDISNYDTEDFFQEESICLFILSTWTDGLAPDTADWFSVWLKDVVDDFRVSKAFKLKYSVFALGDSEYKLNYCRFGKKVDKELKQMGAIRIAPLLCGDRNNEMEKSFQKWSKNICNYLNKMEDEAIDMYNSDSENDGDILDLEEMSGMAEKITESKLRNRNQNTIVDSRSTDIVSQDPAKPMVTPLLHKSLTKQGYKIIGSHSGVKICRWTKSMLRGRGGCYKHTFYNIASHLCMETTPSLACANKCVFCWRHHSNPVGTSWRWQMNEPEEIIDGAIANHQQMIKQLKGMPGVIPERFEEAKTVRHCALSLVGEPIMYPKINEFLDLLHKQQISSFLVTNAQFPEAIRDLKPVTQLYVSIDASTKDSLKEVDRPLFGDFWERFLSSLEFLKSKGQRTVYRLTLVKEFNMSEIEEYVDLLKIGVPDFIEVKGVTYCGNSEASSLTMKNVPYHVEVVRFCTILVKAFNEKFGHTYEISCEHEHSCCVLISNTKFKINNKWHTWIDFDQFHRLLKSGNTFTSTDYMQETPDWAVYGSVEKGFDPEETRFYRKKKLT